MDNLEKGTKSDEESESLEDEEVDPRIQGELEKLNQSTDDINRWESELEDYRQRFRAVLVEATVKLDDQVKRIGRAVDDSKPYWEARRVARQAQVEAQRAAQEFQRAVEILRAAKETIALAEERLLEEDSRQFDSAWQEMLNHATQRVMEAEQTRTRCEAEHKQTAASYNSCINHMKTLEKKLRRTINKSRPYFELKAKYYLQLEQLKRHVDERQSKLTVAKGEYRTALRNLETISEEIHARRQSLTMGARGRGVGAEGEGGHDDITNFKMESDGLSMMSVTFEDDENNNDDDGAETDSSPSSSLSSPCPVVVPIPAPRTRSSSSSYVYPSSSSSTTPCSCLSTSTPTPSLLSSSCPDVLELPSGAGSSGQESLCGSGGQDSLCGSGGPLSLCGSDEPHSLCGSGRASPLLGPRSQCSGASSPDIDQERGGDRAEGAETKLEAGLNRLTLTQPNPEDIDNEPETNPSILTPAHTDPLSLTPAETHPLSLTTTEVEPSTLTPPGQELCSPAPPTAILLLNSA